MGGVCGNCGSALAAGARFCGSCGAAAGSASAEAGRGGLLELGQTLGGYRIESLVARGGMGVVYRAEQIALSRTVALKVIAPEFANDVAFRARFQREARLAAQLNHPNIVAVHEAGTIDGQLFMAMAYVEGRDLGAILAAEGRLGPERVTSLFPQVARALDAAHAAGLVHRDIKPSNILVSAGHDGEHAYLSDFGLTKDAASASGVTRTGEWVGTVDYVAPEQIENRQIDARTDIYSFGCLLYQALAGHIPFEGAGMATMYAHVNTPPPRITEVDPAVAAVVERAMAKDPEERFPSAGDLSRALVAAVRGEQLPGDERSVATGAAASGVATRTEALARVSRQGTRVEPRPPVVARAEPKRRTFRTALAAVALLILGGLVGGGVLLASRSSEGDAAPPQKAASTTATTPKKAKKRRSPPEKPAVTTPAPKAVPPAPKPVSYTPYSPPGAPWSAELPTGGGWSAPSDTEPVPARRYRTRLTGPQNTVLVIDYTPSDVPTFGASTISSDTVRQPFFGTAREYISSDGRVPECAVKCIDYQIDDGNGGGYGILASGSDFELAKVVAARAMRTLSEVGE